MPPPEAAARPGAAGDPLVSVILPVYNRAWCVERAIRSVLAQTYRPLELIVVDDGSTDGTREVVERFGDRVTLLVQERAGAYAARNLALRHARGELVAFADSDDAWLPDRLAAQVPLLRRPEVGLVFGDVVHVTEPRPDAPRTGLTSFAVAPPRRGRAARQFARCNFVPTCTVLVRRACLEEIGGFPTRVPVSADYVAWLRIALRHEVDFVDRPVAEYTVHADGISSDLGRSLAARITLFSEELRTTRDPEYRAILRRLLFNLSLHLVLALARGRARDIDRSVWLSCGRAWGAAHCRAPLWSLAFAARQVALSLNRFSR
ncbi:MAG TPA: glycosyltransferase [Longimicrobiaceae bacterium]|jgi:glycosyltransferase involved in cell wall biosynthesis